MLSEDDLKDDNESHVNEGDEEDPKSEPSSEPTQTSSDDGLSTGTMAGIGVGVGLALVGLIGTAIFFWLRRKRAQKQVQQQGMLGTEHNDMLQHTGHRSLQVADRTSKRAVSKAELYAGYEGRQDYPNMTRYELE